MTQKSLSIITRSCIDLAVIDATRIGIKVVRLTGVKALKFEDLQSIEVLRVTSRPYGPVMISVTTVQQRSPQECPLGMVRRDEIELLEARVIDRIGAHAEVLVICVTDDIRVGIHVLADITELQRVLAITLP